jgi:hypothetical protein
MKIKKITGYRRLFLEEVWGISFQLKEYSLENKFKSLKAEDIISIKSPLNSFYADPFCFNFQGQNYIFFESFDFLRERGKIQYIKLHEDGRYTNPKTILSKGYHLSYPYIFKYRNDIYMVPESGENNSIDLYRAKNFPGQWEYVKTLIKGIKAYDTTIFEHNKVVYLFTYIPSQDNALVIYYSDHLMNEWTLHTRSPIIKGDFNSRPAGSIISFKGNLYRPAQDCRLSYGHSLVLNKINKLSTIEYEEEVYDVLTPDKLSEEYSGTHTININHITVFDYRKIRINLMKPATRLCSKLFKLYNKIYEGK